MTAITSDETITLPGSVKPWASHKGQVGVYMNKARKGLVHNRAGNILEWLYAPWGPYPCSLVWSLGLVIIMAVVLNYYPGIIFLDPKHTDKIAPTAFAVWALSALFVPIILERVAGGYPEWSYYNITNFRTAYTMPLVLEEKITDTRLCGCPKAEFQIAVLKKNLEISGYALFLEVIEKEKDCLTSNLYAVMILDAQGKPVPRP